MRGYFGLGQLSANEKSDILNQHKSIYNGYQTMQPQVSNTQPLTVYDFAGDKEGLVVNNKGEVKKYTNVGINEQVESKDMCEQCGGQMTEGICEQCGTGGEMEEGIGHLDDIYDEEDLSPSGEFDYVSGGGNDYGTFEKAHHMKEQIKTPIGKISSIGSMEEQGGNADDMDVDDVEPAYNFDSNGPMAGGDVYPVNEYDDEVVYEIEFDDEVEDEEMTFEPMESAWAEEFDEQDISGTQGIYSGMKEPYDFDSEGPGKSGPYQTRYESGYEGEDEDAYWEKDLADDELDLDLTEFNPEDKSWEEISQHTGDDEFGYVDEDIKESFINQKNKIMEMMNRISVIK